MRRAVLVHVDAQRRVLAREGAGGTGVIEMDVREQNRAHVADLDPAAREAAAQRRQRGGRTRIDERGARRPVQHRRRDHAADAEKIEVDVGEARRECVHESFFRRARTTLTTTIAATTARPTRPERPIHRSSVSQL